MYVHMYMFTNLKLNFWLYYIIIFQPPMQIKMRPLIRLNFHDQRQRDSSLPTARALSELSCYCWNMASHRVNNAVLNAFVLETDVLI